jgi:3-deoxy-D-manno-octulosonic-acid transferase
MTTLYTSAIRLFGAGIKLAQPFSSKASKWVKGRSKLFSELEEAISEEETWVWVHVASLGEFEQGRPLIEHIRELHPEKCILLTFFSPSGYEVRKNYKGAHFVSYMPLDTPANARRFLNIVNPCLAIFVKYEIWFHHLREMVDRKIPVLLISAQFRSRQIYFKRIGRMFLPVLRRLQQIFVVDEKSQTLLAHHNFRNVMLSGDTRIDRVLQIANKHRNFGFIRDVLQTDQILVAGSTWPEDIALLLPLINSGSLKCVIAPHENDERKISELEKMLTVKSVRLSKILPDDLASASVVIVDTMGDLADIYHVGSVSYVGGGFSSGIHNILEPAAHHLPVIVGPNHKRFAEAQEMIALGSCISVNSSRDIQAAIKQFSRDDQADDISKKTGQYMEKHAGATTRIYDYIQRERLLEHGVDSTVY